MSDVRRERRVTYYEPGTFFSEETTRPIDDGPDIIERAGSADEDAVELLREAQYSQDAGDTWATALAAAEERVGGSA